MIRTASLPLVCATLLLGAWGFGPQDEKSGATGAQPPAKEVDPAQETVEPPPERVLLQVGRYETVRGVVEQENEDLIVVRTEEGDVKSFIKARLLRLVRLVNPDGRAGTVFLMDGTSRRGTIIADEYTHVTLEIEGLRSKLERSLVDHVTLDPTTDELYEAYKASLSPQMHSRRFELCEWLVKQKRYELAEKELASLYRDNPDYPGLIPLMRLVDAQLTLKRGDGAIESVAPGQTRDPSDPRRTGPVDQRDLLPNELLSEEDVNLIRVYEIDFSRPPAVKVRPETIRRLISEHASHPAIPANSDARTAMFRAEPIEVVQKIFEVGARELYPEIEVLTEPYALNLFRQRVHNTWLIQNCATSRCHGGVKAGRLFLHNRNHRDDRVRSTNLMILERLEIPGKPPLINYDEPSASLIIQHALPVTVARYPHPEVQGWSPALTKGNERMLEDAIRWIESMYQPRPEYPVDYEPPALYGEEPDTSLPGGRERVPR